MNANQVEELFFWTVKNTKTDTSALQLLIDAGANIHARGRGYWSSQYHFTPFLIACAANNIKAIHFLIDAGANIEDTGFEDDPSALVMRDGVGAYRVAHKNNRNQIHAILDNAKARQCEVFYHQLFSASQDEKSKVIAKWRAAGLQKSDLAPYVFKDTSESIYGSHTGKYYTQRPQLIAYGPQDPGLGLNVLYPKVKFTW